MWPKNATATDSVNSICACALWVDSQLFLCVRSCFKRGRRPPQNIFKLSQWFSSRSQGEGFRIRFKSASSTEAPYHPCTNRFVTLGN
jgi:hypothetical protein